MTLPMVALLLRPRRSHVRLHVHSGRFADKLKGIRRRVFARFLTIVDDLVVVGPHVAERLSDAGFELPACTRVAHAFIAPDLAHEKEIWQTYPEELRAFAKSHDPLIVMQGSDALEDGSDLYGADLAIEALSELRHHAPHVGLVIGRPTAGDEAFRQYCENQRRRINALGLSSRVHLLTGERELWPLTKASDVFLRPTTTDGDSVSVREALHFGVPVVASDVCRRPHGVVVFQSENVGDLAAKVRAVLSHGSVPTATTELNAVPASSEV
jgi:hypothetical protein